MSPVMQHDKLPTIDHVSLSTISGGESCPALSASALAHKQQGDELYARSLRATGAEADSLRQQAAQSFTSYAAASSQWGAQGCANQR